MKLLSIGYVIDRETLENIPMSAPSGNNFQIGLFGRLKELMGDDLDIVTIFPTPSYPFIKRKIVRKSKIEFDDNKNTRSFFFINIKYLKELSIALSLFFIVCSFNIKHRNEERIILTYNGNLHLALPIILLKNLFKFKLIVMVVDPPLHSGTMGNISNFYRFMVRISDFLYTKLVSISDKIIVLNANCVDLFRYKKPSIVIDVGVDENISSETSFSIGFEKKYFNIVFTGAFTEHSGILRALEAFNSMNSENICFYVYGRGPYEDKVKEYSQDNSNIIFKGFVPTSVARQAQQQADLVICPSYVDHEINKFAFPSKLIECMMSGAPVMATLIKGLPLEYFDYLYSYEDTNDSFCNELLRLINLPKAELLEKGNNAREFIIKNKTWHIIGRNVYEFIK